ncbi:MAG: hypothetical protein KY453_03550, partial [Gemmatimonadetes bacterium]|nr:hypothetical protein [Gemmatimonadota bacterium]
GLGLPSMLRWLWWRVNAWTEIVGMTVATVVAVALYAIFPDTRDEYLLVAIVAVAMTAALAATFLTRPVPRQHLARFVQRVRPPGWWAGLEGAAPRRAVGWTGAAWLAGNVGVFGLMFGLGHVLLGRPVRGAVVAALGAGGIVLTVAALGRARAHLGSGAASAEETTFPMHQE